MLKTLAPNAALGELMVQHGIKHLLSNLLEPAYRRVMSSALAADTVSEPYREWIRAKYDIPVDRMTIITNGANTGMFVPGDTLAARRRFGLDRFDTVIGYVGTLGKIRYVDQIIRALGRIRRHGKVGLVLVGSGDERAELEQLAADEGLADEVIFVGNVPYSDVPDYMRAFDVAVDLTSVEMEVDGRNLLSSFSQKIPQYLASGVPVVAWRCIDTEFLEEEEVGGVASFGDEAELNSVLERLLMLGDDVRVRMKQRARAVAESRFSAVKLAGDRLAWWRSMTSPGNPASALPPSQP